MASSRRLSLEENVEEKEKPEEKLCTITGVGMDRTEVELELEMGNSIIKIYLQELSTQKLFKKH